MTKTGETDKVSKNDESDKMSKNDESDKVSKTGEMDKMVKNDKTDKVSKTSKMDKVSKPGAKKVGIAWLVVALVVMMAGGVLFIGAVSGWFGETKVSLSTEYYCEGAECEGLAELSTEEYEKLVTEKKSFVVVIDQEGCTTAERLKGFAEDYAQEKGMKFYQMMFSEMKETSMHEKVKYYPSVVVVSKGRVWKFLRADSDEDAGAYNRYDEFQAWMNEIL